jgi:SMI1-KNR4 cell-wall
MTLRKLRRILPTPPRSGRFSGQEVWPISEQRHGLTFPNDLKAFIQDYGAGFIVDDSRLRIDIYDPRATIFASRIADHTAVLLGAQSPGAMPYSVFPDSPGLFPLGSDDNGNELYWLTKGSPDEWPIVVRSPEGQFEEHPGPLTTFLAGVLQGKIRVSVWPSPFFSSKGAIRFELAAPETFVESPRNIYQLYVLSGNRADFWARKIDEQDGYFYHVKSINKMRAGPLPGMPDEYGRPPVEADYYDGTTIIERATNMSHSHQPMFLIVDPPK